MIVLGYLLIDLLCLFRLKDGAGLVKKYAMVNVQKYQWVAIGDTVQECEKNYMELLNTNGIVSAAESNKSVSGKIESISPVVLGGNSHYYICLVGQDDIFDVDMTDASLVTIIKYQVGDQVTFQYAEGYGVNEVKDIS